MKNTLKIALLVSSLYMGTAMAAGQFGQFGSGPQLLTANNPSQGGGFNQDDQDDSDQGQFNQPQQSQFAPSASGQFGQQQPQQQFNQGQFNQPQQSQFAPVASGQFNQPQQSQFAPSASGQFNQPQQSQFAPNASGQFGQQQPQQQQSTSAGSTDNTGSGIQIPVAISNMMTPSQVYLQGYSDALNYVSQSMNSTAPAGDTEGGVNDGFSSQQQPQQQQQFAPSASQGQFAQQQQQPQQQAPVSPYSYAVPGEPGGIDPTPNIGVPVNQNSGQGGFSQNQDDQNYQDQDNEDTEDTAGSFNNNQQQLNF